MRLRPWSEMLAEISELNVDPAEWRAVAGNRSTGIGEDLYLGHPRAGVYLLKTYAKNPFEVEGYGSRVARKVDDEIESYFPSRESAGRFAVRTPPENESHAETVTERVKTVVETHSAAPTRPQDFFEDVMEVLESPAFGPMLYDGYDRPESMASLAEAFVDADSALDAAVDERIERQSIGREFM